MQKGRPEGLCKYSIEVPLNCGPKSIYKEWSDKVMRKKEKRKKAKKKKTERKEKRWGEKKTLIKQLQP